MPQYFISSRLSENISETPEGFLLCRRVPITRTGELVYGEGETPLETDDDGQVIVTRDADDVFNVYTLASFEGKPLTLEHPNEFVDPRNWNRYSKGHMQNLRRGDGEFKNHLLADILVMDQQVIQKIKNGEREVSLGYEAEYIQTAEGKGRQRRIVGNHIALVSKGRAGETCAIMDHKGDSQGMASKIADKMKKLFGKALDKAVDEVVAEEKKTATTVDAKSKDKGGKKKPAVKAKAKDADTEAPVEEKAEDSAAYDELKKAHDAMGKMLDAMAAGKEKPVEEKAKDESEEESKDESSEEESKDEEGEGELSLESLGSRLKTLEGAVEKLLDMMASQSSDEESEESEDADEEEEQLEDESAEEEDDEEESEESEDDDFEESSLTGDSAPDAETLARAEILAPGIDKKEKNLKQRALKAAFADSENAKIMKVLNGNKSPTFDSASQVDTLFTSMSEVLKTKRKSALGAARAHRVFDAEDNGHSEVMTAEAINKKNEAHYALKN